MSIPSISHQRLKTEHRELVAFYQALSLEPDLSYLPLQEQAEACSQRLEAFDFGRLARLDLSHRQFTVVPVEVILCQNLEELNLSDNRLQNLPQWVFQLPKIRVLWLNNNPFNDETVQQIQEQIQQIQSQRPLRGLFIVTNFLPAPAMPTPLRIEDLITIEKLSPQIRFIG